MDNKERERIISDLRTLADAYSTIELYGDAIEEALELMDECSDIVHCVDCKNRLTQFCPVYSTKGFTDDDWYCGDGERW